MTASDHLSPGQFYHGTSADLKPGDRVVPGNDIGVQSHGRDSDSARVWMSTNAYRAGAYGHNVYEVAPDDAPKSPHSNDEHYTSGATVVRDANDLYRSHSNRWAEKGF